ncbi:hypothetical protein FJT64_009870 [Amphibalanus amphitrite]|uniref:Circadian clock-controlled protein n=1 Tax=Amphibalanus amphitrite TaxID=1232801 RepID=A0A6A4VS48_AMPAM|nr:uncharacterized protein LOC122374289 [Amphibalanus amphitrite]KAF0292081.1 hypothetical protein FJT64_009870 [Amphibalanus amphitrite]
MELPTAVSTLAALAALLLVRQTGGQLSPGESCPAGDRQQLSGCLSAALERLRPFFRSGIPENNIPPGDPLTLEQVNFRDGPLEAQYTDVVVRGFSAFVLHSLDVDPFGRRLTFNLTVPVANLAGRYNVKGNILGATISSRGTFASEIQTVEILGFGELGLRQSPDGLSDHVQATNLRVKLDIGPTHHQINYEANSERDRVIGETVRKLVTRNDKILLRDVWPEIETKVAEVMSRLVNQVLTIIPVSSAASGVGPAQGALQARGFAG